MYTELNIEEWARKDHFHFFRKFEEPFFGITVEMDCTETYETAKKGGVSFFLTYLHQALKAANQVEPFRYRIAGEEIRIYDKIDASPTIDRPDGTFGFSYMTYHEDFHVFYSAAQKEIQRIRQSSGLDPAVSGQNVIHFSALPWINFTSISHARSFSFEDSCPKISTGKMTLKNQRRVMPVSVYAHHALVDGIHVSMFLEKFQNYLGGLK